jgi:hypothetical protein
MRNDDAEARRDELNATPHHCHRDLGEQRILK